MQATTSYKERIGVFEKFLESIDKFYKDNGKYFWLKSKRGYVELSDEIEKKASELGIDINIKKRELLSSENDCFIEIERK